MLELELQFRIRVYIKSSLGLNNQLTPVCKCDLVILVGQDPSLGIKRNKRVVKKLI